MEIEVLNYVFCVKALIGSLEEGNNFTVKRLKEGSRAWRKANKLDIC